MNVVIDKPGKGAMLLDTMAEDGVIQIAQVSYFANADLAIANGAEKDWTRNALYAGPPFANLDEGLQDLLERYLDERGVDASLAAFVPDYIDYKEQKEYMRWLGGKFQVPSFRLFSLTTCCVDLKNFVEP